MKIPKFFPNPVAIWGFLTDKSSDWKPKAALVVAILYVVCPFDFDWIPLLGWIDDTFVAALAAWYVQHATNTWQMKQLIAAQAANQVATEEDAPQIVEGSGVSVADELEQAEAQADAEVEAVSVSTGRSRT